MQYICKTREERKSSNLRLIGCCEVDDVEVENKEGNKKNHPEENKKEREEHNSDRDMKDFNIHEKEISGENTLNVAVDNVGR